MQKGMASPSSSSSSSPGVDGLPTAAVSLILQALGFSLVRASEDGYLQPCASKQGGEGDDT